MSKHPMQPIEKDEHGTYRFKENAIVRYLLDNGGIDLNKLATLPFSKEDREQFAMLIGYSVGGFSELSYNSAETIEVALDMCGKKKSELEVRNKYLRDKLKKLRKGLVKPIADLYNTHPDNFSDGE